MKKLEKLQLFSAKDNIQISPETISIEKTKFNWKLSLKWNFETMFVKSYTSNILKIWIISKRHLQNNLKMVLVWIIDSGMYLWKPDLTYIFKAE